jgi:membrane-associated phospholipid phosphatase
MQRIALAGLLLVAASPSLATAEPVERVAWQDHWPRVHGLEYAAAGAFGVGALVIALAIDQRTSGWQGGMLHDGMVRELLRLRTRAGRDNARAVGDMGYRIMLVYPFLDAIVTAWAVHGNADVAWQMFAIDAEAMALAGLIGLLTDHFIGRGRPSQRACQQDAEYERFCNEPDEFVSFVSGHATIAAAGAGLTCAHHGNLPLYGGGGFDLIACGAAVGLAAMTGIARIANDRHWATDVSAGLLLGGLIGVAVPSILHYRRLPARQPGAVRPMQLQLRLLPLVGPGVAAGVLVARY